MLRDRLLVSSGSTGDGTATGDEPHARRKFYEIRATYPEQCEQALDAADRLGRAARPLVAAMI